MRSPLRDLALISLFGCGLSLTECSELTKVDWSQVRPEATAGTAGVGGSNPGEGGMAGEAGAAAGEAGALEGGSAGIGGTIGGSAGRGGGGGRAGAGGLSGHGGAGANAGTGGSPTLVHTYCTVAPPVPNPLPDVSQAIVLFDGGPGVNGNRGGRAGLDAACQTAKTALGLPHAATHAVISVTNLIVAPLTLPDDIFDMPENYNIPRIAPHVVSPIGIQIADSWDSLWKAGGVPSLVCTGVMPETVDTWLTGCGTGTAQSPSDPLTQLFGGYDFYLVPQDPTIYNNGCNGWTSSAHSANEARVGSTVADNDAVEGPWFLSLPNNRLIYCDFATQHILCVAYNP